MTMSALPFGAEWALNRATAAAGTAITGVINPKGRKKTKIGLVKVTSQATQHTVTALFPLAKTTVISTTSANGTVLQLARDPGAYAANAISDGRPVPSVADNPIGANDLVIVQLGDGTWKLGTVSSAATAAANGSLNVTLSATLSSTANIPAGAEVHYLGISTDTNPTTGLPHPFLGVTTVNSTASLGDGVGPLAVSPNQRDAALLYINNATNNSTLETAYGFYA